MIDLPHIPARVRAHRMAGFVIAALLGWAPPASSADAYPAKPIKLLVPFAAGGAPDIVARNISRKLSERLGQSVVVENRAGAGGNIAYEAVARSDPDGYTLVFATNGIATNMSLYKDLPFDTMKDFAPVSLVARSGHVIVMRATDPVHSVRELIDAAKARPATISYGSSGSGTIPHLAGEMFGAATGVRFLHVPYRGMALAQTDLLGGSIQLIFSDAASALPNIKAGKIRALAVTSAQRLVSLPEVPTVQEAGVPGYDIEAWFGILAPAGTPANIVQKLNRELAATVNDPGLKQRMLEQGQVMTSNTPAEFSAYLDSEIRKMRDIVAKAQITVN